MAERITQAQWDAERAERKAVAAETIKANAEAALEAKIAALRGETVDAQIVSDEDTERPYADYSNAELADFLKERGLPHSGNKDELIARLEEDDNSDSE